MERSIRFKNMIGDYRRHTSKAPLHPLTWLAADATQLAWRASVERMLAATLR